MATAENLKLDSPRMRRYQKAADLLVKWMSEENGYDESTWPLVDAELKDSSVRCREQDEITD